MNRLYLIWELILGKDIVVYNYWKNNEIIAIIGNDDDILKEGHNYITTKGKYIKKEGGVVTFVKVGSDE